MTICPMATHLQATEIDQLQHINQIPIAEIERRARPGAYAVSGFLGPQDSFKKVLKGDWQQVQTLGCTHQELARQLRNIWNQVDSNSTKIICHSFENSIIERSERVTFRIGVLAALVSLVAAVVGSPFALLGLIPAFLFMGSTKQPLIVMKNGTRGLQQDLFAPADSCSGWNEEMTLINPLTNAKVTVGEGVIDYIERYGFYEGGDQNAYRVDPIKLISILSGATPWTLTSKWFYKTYNSLMANDPLLKFFRSLET